MEFCFVTVVVPFPLILTGNIERLGLSMVHLAVTGPNVVNAAM
jgi:hypothetical protein